MADLTGMTQAEMVERIDELERFRAEWTPFLVSLAQTLHAMSKDPMFKMVSSMLPPQAQTMLATIGA
jgi:hypothetical protein